MLIPCTFFWHFWLPSRRPWLNYEFCYKARAITPATTIAQIIDILVVLLDKFNFTVDYWVCYHFLPFFICGGVDLIAVIN